MKILITGSSGFLGKHLIRHLVTVKPEYVRIFGLFYSADEKNLLFKDSCQYLKADILDNDTVASIVRNVRPDGVIHLSGMLRGSLHRLFQTNVEGTATILEALRQNQRDCRFIYVSSSAVYGYSGDAPISERTNPNPISTYGITKIAGEYIAKQYSQLYQMPITIIRPFNIIGPGQSPDFITGSIIRQAVRVIKGEQEQIVVRNVKGRRDFIDVRDVVSALYKVITIKDFNQNFTGQCFNVCSGKEQSITELIAIISQICKAKIAIQITEPDGEEMIPTQVGDSSKIFSIIGCQPLYNLEQSLLDMITSENELYLD
jgi:GDP-4-dehydro-6-deoxy-D-mannose reductase